MPDRKDDLIGRRVNDAGKIYNWVRENPLAFLCTFLTVMNIVFIWLFISSKNENIELTSDLNSKIIEEVRRQVPRAVKEEVPAVVDSKLEGVREGVDTALSKVNTIVEKIGGR